MTGTSADKIASLLNCSFIDACRRRRPAQRQRIVALFQTNSEKPFEKLYRILVQRGQRKAEAALGAVGGASLSAISHPLGSSCAAAIVGLLRVFGGGVQEAAVTAKQCALHVTVQQCAAFMYPLFFSCFLRRCHIIARSLGHLLLTVKKNGSSSASIISAANYLRPAP